MSTALLKQMKQIFKQLAEVQCKLDFEIEERRRRTDQHKVDKMTQLEDFSEPDIIGRYSLRNRRSNYTGSQPAALYSSQEYSMENSMPS